MYTVLIADDELTILEGLKYVINWEDLGFQIIREASNGEDALAFILKKNPDVAMLDIRMPKLGGLDIVKEAREQGYTGKIIILSGYTEFKYAQTAIRYGVEYYLTKPIDEDELTKVMQEIRQNLIQESKHKKTIEQYRSKARSSILYEIITGTDDVSHYDAEELNLQASEYQIVIYEKYNHNATDMPYHFCDLLKVTNDGSNCYENITIDNNEVLLLKGSFIMKKFQEYLTHYEIEQKPQANSPLDSLFITYGRVVTSIENIHISYHDALRLLKRRFFYEHRQHTIGYDQLPEMRNHAVFELSNSNLQNYCEQLIGYIQTAKRNQVAETLNELEKNLYCAEEDISKIKLFLTDLYLSIKERISHLYHNIEIPFPGNAQIIKAIDEKYYLYEIILFFTEQFELIIRTIGSPSSSGLMDDIIYYIEHNYMDNIKLENIAPLFGYNSSYLGKIFTKRVGIGFNMFVDQVRIKHSKKLLTETDLKVYEISEKVGYRNVDYFHTKFKKYVEQSPAEYRKINSVLHKQ